MEDFCRVPEGDGEMFKVPTVKDFQDALKKYEGDYDPKKIQTRKVIKPACFK